jgi:hypothetical protein
VAAVYDALRQIPTSPDKGFIIDDGGRHSA